MKDLLDRITIPNLWRTSVTFLALISPAFVAFYYFGTWASVDSWPPLKIILFCVSLTLPFVILNAYFLGFLDEKLRSPKEEERILIKSALATMFVWYFTLIISVLGESFPSFISFVTVGKQKIGLKHFMVMSLVVQSVVALILWRYKRTSKGEAPNK